MKTKPFNLEESKAGAKVVTRDGREVEILSYNCKIRESQPILAQIKCSKGAYELEYYYDNGCAVGDKNKNLFLVSEEEEKSTEFEKELAEAYEWAKTTEREDFVNEFAPKLLDLARKELQPEFDKQMDKMLAETDKVVYQKGQQDALKDLPKWKKVDSNPAKFQYNLQGKRLYKDGEYYIDLIDLEKLPKEE